MGVIRRIAQKRVHHQNVDIEDKSDGEVSHEEELIVEELMAGQLRENFWALREKAIEMLQSDNAKEREIARQILEEMSVEDFIREDGGDEEGFVDKFLRKKLKTMMTEERETRTQ